MSKLLIMALIGVLLLVVGCGGDDEGESTASTSSAASTEATATPEGTESTGGEDQAGIETGPDADGSAGPSEADSGGEPLQEAEVRKLVERFATSNDPEDCELATETLLNRSFGGLAGCRAIAQSGLSADSVSFGAVEVDGQEAVAEITPKGGPAAGLEIQVRVIRQDGELKIDQFRAPGIAPGP